jgi:dTDP-4-amino-4,6-dideoxygalactose transaminase
MIPLFTLERQNKILEKELDKAVKEVMRRGIFILGSKVTEFEEMFSRYIGTKYAVGVASGTDALTLSLFALGVGENDEVIIPANSYPTAFAVAAAGALPKLVDIDPFTYTIDPEKIVLAITKKTKAIIPVHLYGQPANMKKIMEIGKKYKLFIIEDCAQAHGAALSAGTSMLSKGVEISFKSKSDKSLGLPAYRQGRLKEKKIWKKVGSLGDVGCFSFYPTKNLGCFGDGGMVVTNNPEIAKRVRLFRMYGERERYNSVLLGKNSRLDELQAAILLVKLKHLDEWNEKRRGIAGKYLSRLGELGLPARQRVYVKHVYHLFVIRTGKREELKDYLLKKGIQTAVHYPLPIHLVSSFSFLGYKKGDFPESEKASREILSLPMFPELTFEEVEKVAEEIKNFYS